jgi:hypothetical protein
MRVPAARIDIGSILRNMFVFRRSSRRGLKAPQRISYHASMVLIRIQTVIMRQSFALFCVLSGCATPGTPRWQAGHGGPSDPSQPSGWAAQHDPLIEEQSVGQSQTDGADPRYTCPMHSEVSSLTAGRCPKCGMTLIKKAPKAVHLRCPMHREVTADAPGNCRICGMALVPVDSSNSITP